MKAVEKDNIQSVISEIASETDPEVNVDENENSEEQKPNENQNADDASNQNDDDGAGKDDDENKDNKAFAAMRVANKELRERLEKLEAKDKVETEPDKKPDEVVDPLAIKDTDSEEVKLLKLELAEIKKTTTEFKEDKNKRVDAESKAKLVGELTKLKTDYTLDEKALLDFADDAQKQGFILGESKLTMDQIYKVVYHDTIMANAIKAVETKTNEDLAPGSGPGGKGLGNKGSASPKDVLSSIIKDMDLK